MKDFIARYLPKRAPGAVGTSPGSHLRPSASLPQAFSVWSKKGEKYNPKSLSEKIRKQRLTRKNELYHVGFSIMQLHSADEDWSATVGFTPPSPGWNPGATLSLLVAHWG
jgi:hypothetical protein